MGYRIFVPVGIQAIHQELCPQYSSSIVLFFLIIPLFRPVYTMATDFANEKQETTYIENAHDSPTDASLNLEKERTLEGIDVQNRHALKGDDSDGKVVWSLRSIFAAIFLAGLYTG